jgi:hypothetical protein
MFIKQQEWEVAFWTLGKVIWGFDEKNKESRKRIGQEL